MKFKHFISITKPGIVMGNVITAIAGFFTGMDSKMSVLTLLAMVVGLSAVMASACVVNNYIDQDIDKLMSRTKKRLDIYQQFSTRTVWIYAMLLLIAGSLILYFFTNLLALSLALLGFFAYLFFYTLWLKRRSPWGTLAGSFSGATPPVIGYCAISGVFDLGAVALFLLLTTWQMPHFHAISLYRMKDYKNAGIPVLSVVKGAVTTQYRAMFWLVLFIASLFFLIFAGNVHWICGLLMIACGIVWVFYGYSELKKGMRVEKWGYRMFFISLVNIFVISFALCLSPWL